MPLQPKTYKKKPVVVEAVQFTNQAVGEEIANWCGGRLIRHVPIPGAPYYEILIPTLEGNMIASMNDWIIRGIKGEFYPCKPDIFLQSYDIFLQTYDAN